MSIGHHQQQGNPAPQLLLPPELALPVPRPVGPARRFWMMLALAVALVLVLLIQPVQRLAEATSLAHLKARGAAAVAHVTRLYFREGRIGMPAARLTPPAWSVSYEFSTGGQTYRRTAYIPKADFTALQEGSLLAVRYDPDMPRRSTPEAGLTGHLQDEGDRFFDALWILAMLLLPAVPGMPVFSYLRERRLLSRGIALPARIESVGPYRGNPKSDRVDVAYAFTLRGETLRGKRTWLKEDEADEYTDNPVVLIDPANEERHALYPFKYARVPEGAPGGRA